MKKDVLTQAQSALAKSPIHALRELRVQLVGESLILSGRVGSFYHKQLAQEVVRRIASDLCVVNAVVVNYDERRTP